MTRPRWTSWWASGRPGAYSHASYVEAMEAWAESGTHSGPEDSEAMAGYTALNAVRMRRVAKTYSMGSEMQAWLASGRCRGQHWVVITESWCGDAVQTGPILAHMAAVAGVPFEWVLRDADHDIMSDFLTRGGRSIPIWIVADQRGQVLSTWGPRPKTVQEMVMAHRALPEPKPPYSEFVSEVQLWYSRNRGREFEAEALEMLQGIGGT